MWPLHTFRHLFHWCHQTENSLLMIWFWTVFLTRIEFQQVKHTWRALQLRLMAVPELRLLTQQFSPLLACAQTGSSCYWRNWTQKKQLRRRRKVHDLKCTIDSKINVFSSLMCVCTDAFLTQRWGQSLTVFYVSSIFWQKRRAHPEGVRGNTHFPPCCDPCCATLLQ